MANVVDVARNTQLSLAVAPPADDAPSVEQRQGVILTSTDADNANQAGRNACLAKAIIPPCHHRAIGLERHGMAVTTVNGDNIGGSGGHIGLAPLVAPPGDDRMIAENRKGEARPSANGEDVGLSDRGNIPFTVEILAPRVEVTVFGQCIAVGDRSGNILEEQGTQIGGDGGLLDAQFIYAPGDQGAVLEESEHKQVTDGRFDLGKWSR